MPLSRYLPPVIAEQYAAAFLGEVEHSPTRARRAVSDETYDIAAEIAVPAAAAVPLRQLPRRTTRGRSLTMTAGGLTGLADVLIAALA